MDDDRTAMIDLQDLEAIARGAGILGTGGGGDPYIGRLLAEAAISEYGPVRLVDPAQLPEDSTVVAVAMMGSPTVMVEKPPTIEQLESAIGSLIRHASVSPTHISCLEIGGINSMIPIVAAARTGLPLVDADGMGRAFPEVQMVLPTTFGIRATPMGYADEKGNSGLLDTVDNQWTERIARAMAVQMGSSMMMANYVMSGVQVRKTLVLRTVTLCHQLGKVVERSRRDHADPVSAVAHRLKGVVLGAGTVVDVERNIADGFTRGQVTIETVSDGARHLQIAFQNENLIAALDGSPVATTPNLIMVLDDVTGETVTTDALRYGQRVRVVAAPCDARWHTNRGIALAGPRRFGYDMDPISPPGFVS